MTTELTAYEPRDIGELREFAKEVADTDLVPTAYKGKPADAMVAMMYGKETAGLGPLTSLQFVAVINGRPAFYSDAMPGIAFQKKLIVDMEERFEGEPYKDDFKAVCIVERPNGRKVKQEFSVADAKRAGLWDERPKVQRTNKRTGQTYTADNDSPWYRFPKRMMQWRAKGWAIRDAAPHMLFGPTVEELRDVSEEHQGPDNAKDVTPEHPAQPLSAPSLVTLYDAWGAEYLIEPGEVEQWIKDAIEGSTEEELRALLENNAENARVCEAAENEVNARMTAMAQPDPEPQAKPKTAKQRAQEIAQAFDRAINMDVLLKLEEEMREDIARLPDIAKSRIAAIFHAKRGELEKAAQADADERSFHDTIDELEPEEWRNAEGRIEDERQPELLP